MQGTKLKRFVLLVGLSSLSFLPVTSNAAIIAYDGGITFWISYDNLDSPGAELADTVTLDSNSYTCGVTNGARSTQGAPNSPDSCPGAGNSCAGEDKLVGDIEKLAGYIYQATEGEHYLRRVYVADQGRAWDTADIRWNVGDGGSSAPSAGWKSVGSQLKLNSSSRSCIHDVLHHEIGHYFYNLPDRYAKSGGYYKGTINGSSVFNVDVTTGDPNTVMASNFPHVFVDTTNASITVNYNPPSDPAVTGEVLTPALLSDADPDNDGPDRAHHGHTMPFSQDEWSILPDKQIDLTGVHTEGSFPTAGGMPAVDIRIIPSDAAMPGTMLLLDRSGSMGVTTNGITAAQYVQESGLYLYHSSSSGDYVGTSLYNATVEELFSYDLYDSTNQLPMASFRNASGLTNIAAALESAIDALVAEHGEDGVNGGQIILMSDGKQTTGGSIWDQVDRANGMGIKIHTMSFGNADETTMQQIADNSSGSLTTMSERSSGADLKLEMSRMYTTLRGNDPVYTYRGPVVANSESSMGDAFKGEFMLPPNSHDLLFYAFLDQRNAADLIIELKHSSGFSTTVTGQSLARKGRFNGVRIPNAKAGEWAFKISASKRLKYRLPTNDNIEIVAYADNQEIQGRVWMDNDAKDFPVKRVIKASLDNRYPLTDMKVTALIYKGAKLVEKVPLYDNGKSGADDYSADGIYSGVIDMQKWIHRRSFLRWFKRDDKKLRIDVEFQVSNESVPAPNAHYETGTKYDMLLEEYIKRNRAEFVVYATQTIAVTPRKKQPVTIDIIKPKQSTTSNPGDKGVLVVNVTGTVPMIDQTRVSLGQGVFAQVAGVEPFASGFGARLRIVYKVNKDAKAGVRDLKLQFGRTQLSHKAVINVANGDFKRIKVPDIQRGDRFTPITPTTTPTRRY